MSTSLLLRVMGHDFAYFGGPGTTGFGFVLIESGPSDLRSFWSKKG